MLVWILLIVWIYYKSFIPSDNKDLQEQDKSSDIKQQSPFGDRK